MPKVCRFALACGALALASLAAAAQDRQELEADAFRARCIGCHAMGCNRSGPKLGGVFGRRAGTVADFAGYTEALKASGLIWDEKTLDRFLADPEKLVPGTLMSSAGKIADARERRRLIGFIKRGGRSLDLCF